MVVLASSPTMDCGSYSHELLRRWAPSTRNLVLATQRTAPGTLAHALLGLGQRELRYDHRRRVALEGAELEAALSARRQAEQRASGVVNMPIPPVAEAGAPLKGVGLEAGVTFYREAPLRQNGSQNQNK